MKVRELSAKVKFREIILGDMGVKTLTWEIKKEPEGGGGTGSTNQSQTEKGDKEHSQVNEEL